MSTKKTGILEKSKNICLPKEKAAPQDGSIKN